MVTGLRQIFTAAYAPHGYCLLWQPWLIWSHVASDVAIALAYFSIPIALVIFVRRRSDIAFGAIFWLFALFITACGLTHVMRIWNMWHGDYAAEALVKIATALLSVMTAIVLWPLLPKLLALTSPEELRRVNEALRAEISGRRKAEAALLQAQKMEAVGRLSGGMAHDFNNLFQVIGGNLSLIAHRAAHDPNLRSLADNAQLSIERGVRLTAQLMSFSEVQTLSLHPVHVADIANDIDQLLTQTLPPAISLDIVGRDTPATVLADGAQLELAILAMAINAREAMPSGGALRIAFSTCHVADRRDLADGRYVRIAVSDTGVGMSPDVAQRAFDPFFSTKPTGLSSGLGLSMVYGMARQSGGTTTVESEPGRGATVTLYLRSIEATATADAPPADEAVDPAAFATLHGRHILLVDDEMATRHVVALTLESLGCKVSQAESGAEALTRMAELRPDLFLLDFAMPGMTGAETAVAIRAERPDSRIMFLTGFADSGAIEAAAGKDAIVLHKPASMRQLGLALIRAFAGLGTVGAADTSAATIAGAPI